MNGLVREGGRAGNSRLHPEITEPLLPALERFLNKIPFSLPFFLHRTIYLMGFFFFIHFPEFVTIP